MEDNLEKNPNSSSEENTSTEAISTHHSTDTNDINIDSTDTVSDREYIPRRRNARIRGNKRKNTNDNKKKLTKKQKLKIAMITILILFILLGMVLGVYVYKANGNLAEAVLNVATDVLGDKDPIFVLLLGVSKDISNDLTDTIILCGYNPDSQKAFMLSIPRDTFVGKSERSANGYDKINALYQKDVTKTVEAVEKLTGINVDNYVVVQNTALPAIVNAIGEVEFDVPIDMDYDDPTQDLHIHLKAGMQSIDGEKAEYLLRFRHNNDGTSYPSSYGDNDYGRMRTQREFMKVVAKHLISWNNANKLKEIATAIFDNVQTNMSLGKIVGYIPYALKYDTETIQMEQLPGSSALINQLWFYKASSSQTKEMIDELILSLEMEDKEIPKYYTKQINKKSTSSEDESNKNKTNTTNSNTTKQKNVNKNASSTSTVTEESKQTPTQNSNQGNIEEQAKKEAEEQARKQAEEQAKKQAEEQAKKQAEEQAKKQAEEQAEEQAKKQAEEQAKKQAEEQAKKEAEEQAKKQAEEQAKKQAEEQAKKQAEEQAKKEAEEQAKKEAEEQAKKEAEEQAKKEAEEQAKKEEEQAKKQTQE